jgi:hypothetical protein
MKYWKKYLVLISSILLIPNSIFAIGTYSQGWVVAKIKQLESRGIIFTSYEGVMEITSFNPKEECDETKGMCFTPEKKDIEFSIKPENADLINLLNQSINKELILEFNIHRIKSLALSTDFELLDGKDLAPTVPEDHPDKLIVERSGSKRNFSVNGKILQLEIQGTLIKTYEGLYLDETRGKVHPFSITNPKMADFAWKSMKSTTKFFLGVSESFVKGFRKSDHDIFEINYKEPAGGVQQPKKPDVSLLMD